MLGISAMKSQNNPNDPILDAQPWCGTRHCRARGPVGALRSPPSARACVRGCLGVSHLCNLRCQQVQIMREQWERPQCGQDVTIRKERTEIIKILFNATINKTIVIGRFKYLILSTKHKRILIPLTF